MSDVHTIRVDMHQLMGSASEEVRVLGNTDVIATCAVRDVEKAKTFYQGTLGLTPLPTQETGVLSYKSGKSSLLVYVSQYAGTNKATAATWAVDDLEAT